MPTDKDLTQVMRKQVGPDTSVDFVCNFYSFIESRQRHTQRDRDVLVLVPSPNAHHSWDGSLIGQEP